MRSQSGETMSKIAGNLSQNFKRVFLETTFFELACAISQVLMNRFIWNLVWMFFIHSSIASTTLRSKFLILLFLKKFGIAKKHAKKENFFSNGRHFVKKYFFDVSKVHAITASILIKNPFDIFASHDQKGWNHMHARTPFFLDPSLWPIHNFVNFESFSVNFLYNLKISINKW